MKPLYLDTGLILKLLVQEPLSPVIRDFIAKRRVPVWFPTIVSVEAENSLQAMRFRKQLTAVQLTSVQNQIAKMHADGKFVVPPLSLDDIGEEMLALAPSITARTGCRTLDLLHIAAARLLQAPIFVSTDKRQLAAARLAGLKTKTFSST